MEPSHWSSNSPIHWPTDWATHWRTHRPTDQLTDPPTLRPTNQRTNGQGVELYATYYSFFTAINSMFDSAKQHNLSDKYSIQMLTTDSAISSNRLPKLKPSANASDNFKTNQGVFKSLNAASDLFLRKSCNEKWIKEQQLLDESKCLEESQCLKYLILEETLKKPCSKKWIFPETKNTSVIRW